MSKQPSQKTSSKRRRWFLAGVILFLGSCASTPRVTNVSNACEIFRDHPDWYDAAQKAQQKWGTPISTKMAIIWQESKFNGIARPKKKYILGFIPNGNQSSAYGYAQAIDGTWDWYKKDTGSGWASRDDFKDAIDFVGWYMDKTRQTNGLAFNDAFSHYLAYHEGHGGYKRGTYKSKSFLTSAASNVARMNNQYQQQLMGCEAQLRKSKGFFS